MMRTPFLLTLTATTLVFSSCSQPPEPSIEIPTALAADVGEIAAKSRIVDLSVLVDEDVPAHFGTNPPFQRWTFNWFEPKKSEYGTIAEPGEAAYFGQRYVIDEHTGTQIDFPAHVIPPPDSGLEHAGPAGAVTGDKYPLERLMGLAAVVDVSAMRDAAEPGMSPRITVAMIEEWESTHGPIEAGEVVLFRSGYSNAYFKPLPEGLRLTFEPAVEKSKAGWPAPTPEVMEHLHGKGVWHLGTDGPSMGYTDGGIPTHAAGLKYGMSWTELLINLDQLPARGAYFVSLPLKIADQSGSPARAIAFVPQEE